MPIDLLLPDKHGVSQAHAMFVSQSQFHREKISKSQDKNCERYGEILMPSAAQASLNASAGVFQPREAR